MKMQYLGDSKDSFKWDYHDYLTSALGYPTLNIILMLTEDNSPKSREGRTDPKDFPARKPIIDFCENLRKAHDIQFLKKLPSITGASYAVNLHKGDTIFTNRGEYFSGLNAENKQVLFLDQDNGFEPDKSNNEKHILYSDVDIILKQVAEDAVVSVFHHFRRIPFDKDFACIRERLLSGYATAIHWQPRLMFVIISRSKETLCKVVSINHQYSRCYPVKVLK